MLTICWPQASQYTLMHHCTVHARKCYLPKLAWSFCQDIELITHAPLVCFSFVFEFMPDYIH